MSEQFYYNYNGDDRGAFSVENNSIVFKIKRAILDGVKNAEVSLRKKVRKNGKNYFKHKLLSKKIPRAYRAAAKNPVDENKIVFVEIRLPYLTNSLQIMFDELANNYDYNIHTHFLLNGNTIRADYTQRCINAVEDIATAKYVFIDEGSNALSAMPLRPETKIIQLWHGCGAFKKFGFSTADLIFGESRKEQLRHPFNKNYSLVTVSSPEVAWAYYEAMNIDEKSGVVQATGSSRTDIFYDNEFLDSARRHLYEVVPQAKGKKVILYAPTFRGRVAKAKAPDMLNVKMFYEALGDEYVLLFKYHPHVKNPPVVEDEYKDFAMDVGNVLTIEELLSVSDICISDYSSLVFEYSLFEKPLIFFAYDLDEYFDWRGFYYDYYELAPGLIAKTNFEMIDYIQHIDERFDKKAIQDFRYKFMRSCDGHATQRILEYAFDNLESHKKPCETFEHFYTVPRVESSYFPYYKRVQLIKEQKEVAQKLYDEARGSLKKGSVVAFDIVSQEVLHSIKKRSKGSVTIVNGGDKIEDVISAVANAECVIIDSPNTLLDCFKLRDETRVVLLPTDAYPLSVFGKISKQYRSNLFKEQYALAPLYSSVTDIVAPSKMTAGFYKKAIGKDVNAIIAGDVKTDIFFDEEYKQHILEKLYEAHPDFEGRKIIAYVSSKPADDEMMKNDSFIYEYLYKDYVFIKIFGGINLNNVTTSEYYADSIVDASEILNPYEALAVADIAIGDLNSAVLSFMSTGKPLFIYCESKENAIEETESFVNPEESVPIKIFDDMNDIIKIILDIENYDYSRYNELREKYLAKCDGKSTKRLLKALTDNR